MTPQELTAKYKNYDIQHFDYPLDDIETVDWPSLEHAYGKATNLPALLRATVSKNEKDRDLALSILFETIVHQGTIYQATSYTIPFIYKLILSPPTPDKRSLISLLGHLAHSEPPFTNKIRNTYKWRNILKKQGTTIEKEIAKGKTWSQRIKDEIAKSITLLYPLIDDKDAKIRGAVSFLFSACPDHAESILPLLRRAASVESYARTKQQIERSIEILENVKSSD